MDYMYRMSPAKSSSNGLDLSITIVQVMSSLVRVLLFTLYILFLIMYMKKIRASYQLKTSALSCNTSANYK